MSILVSTNTKVLVQGITGRDGGFHVQKMQSYGTNIVGGVSTNKGGVDVNGVPVFNTVEEGVLQTGANTSFIFVPAALAADAIMEAADGGFHRVPI